MTKQAERIEAIGAKMHAHYAMLAAIIISHPDKDKLRLAFKRVTETYHASLEESILMSDNITEEGQRTLNVFREEMDTFKRWFE